MLSREAEYAIQALLKLATYDGNRYVSILNLSKELDIPFFYLSKILQKLVKQNILRSHKGPKGGVAFAVDPKKTTIYDIVVTVDSAKFFENCVLGLHECNSDAPCPLHDRWDILREEIKVMFGHRSIFELGNDPEVIRRAQLLAKKKAEAQAEKP